MDEAYNKHSRRNKSPTNLAYSGTMAPLSSHISSIEAEYYTDSFPFHQPATIHSGTHTPHHPRNYVHFSAPTSPGPHAADNPLSMTPIRRPVLISKSKSHIELPSSSTINISAHRPPRRTIRRPALLEHLDSDWMPRAAVALSESASEINGQSWMISSTNESFATAPSLCLWEHHYEMEQERERERERQRMEHAKAAELRALARRSSRPSSTSLNSSKHGSRLPSRVQSRVSFAGLPTLENQDVTIVERRPKVKVLGLGDFPGPDFVDANDKLEAEMVFREYHGLAQVPLDDELAIKRLVKEGTSPKSWIATVMGWKRNLEDNDDDDEEEEIQVGIIKERKTIQRHFEGVSSVPEENMPPPKADEGGWSDAAWLLSLVSKIIL